MLAAARQRRPPISLLYRSSSTSAGVKEATRALLRETAQPVAVVTSLIPTDATSSLHFHGATLSSFTSVALDPYPLVAFSLRIPSRMANAIKDNDCPLTQAPRMVVNLLSSTQSQTAIRFSRPDLYPEPFRLTPYTLTEEGLPVLTGSLGALSCRVISCTPLHDLRTLQGKDAAEVEDPPVEMGGLISELFIARVLRVEKVEGHTPGEPSMPLLYHRRQYARVHPVTDTKHHD